MKAIFQQAPFDDKNDLKRIEAIAKEVEERFNKNPLKWYGTCDKCGWQGRGISKPMEGTFTCIKCLVRDEVERRFKEKK